MEIEDVVQYYRIKRGELPPAVETPWTDAEIQHGLAFRTLDDRRVCCFEICAKCASGFYRGDSKLGYSTGVGLCFSCAQIANLDSRRELADIMADLLDEKGANIKELSDAAHLKRADAEKALHKLALADRAERRGLLWYAPRKRNLIGEPEE